MVEPERNRAVFFRLLGFLKPYRNGLAISVILAIGSKDFTSLPRYLGALFPCLIAAALVTRRQWQWVAMLAVNCALLLWATYYVFAIYIVP